MANGDVSSVDVLAALQRAVAAADEALRALAAAGVGGFAVGLASNARSDLREVLRLVVTGGGDL